MPVWHRGKLLWLCRKHLEPLRREFGPVTIFSGHRSARHNDNVGGAPRSYHLAIRGRPGAAADVACATGSPYDWYRWLNPRVAGGLGRYSSFVHVDTRRGRARW
jgi:uncharacterized protein YcbK (DUF882 family)